jgi:hypothetical protein
MLFDDNYNKPVWPELRLWAPSSEVRDKFTSINVSSEMMLMISLFGQLRLWAPSSGVQDVFKRKDGLSRVVLLHYEPDAVLLKTPPICLTRKRSYPCSVH